MKSTEVQTNNETTNTKPQESSSIPVEELLGSTYNSIERSDSKSQQLRTSARVFKKMKLDSAVTAAPPAPLETKKETTKEDAKPEGNKRPLRPTWTQEDKNIFFEALNEYGKDFEAIHSHISCKLRKKGLPDSVMKTKDQVRHFYYRTWHKISKHLKFSDDIKKVAQELYGLINYGELRKKAGSVSEKTCMKLNELIYRGSVAVRTKGKTLRIKTPMCRALRKINQLDEKHDDLKLPTRINVELVSKDMNTWLKVQGLAQNPRIKASLPLQKRLSTLIKFLNCKWKSLNALAYESLLNSSSMADCEKKPFDDKLILDPCLRLSPPSKVHIEMPSVNVSEYFTAHSICLNAFEERIGVKTPGEQLWVIKGGTKKGGTKRSRNESNSDKILQLNNKLVPAPPTDNNENCINESNDILANVDEVVDETVNTLLALQQALGQAIEEEKNDGIKTEVGEDIKNVEKVEESINNIRNGWTSYNCGTITLGELYLMFGSNSCLTLDYSWDEIEISPKTEPDTCDNKSENKDIKLTESLGTQVKVNEPTHKSTESEANLTGTLQKLLSIAKLHYRKNIIRCPCGHVCDGKPKEIAEQTSNFCDTTQEKIQPTISTSVVATSVVPIIIQSPVRPFPSTSVFRRPVSPNIEALKAQLDSIQRFKPRYCNRRGRRPRAKQVVVERRLPLLPNRVDSGRQIVQMNIIAQEEIGPSPRTIAPKILTIDKAEHNINSMNVIQTPASTINHTNVANPIHTDFTGALNIEVQVAPTTLMESSANLNLPANCNSLDITDNAVTPSRVGSPTSISNLLDLALQSHGDNILEGKDETNIPSFAGLLSSSTPPTSPSRILKENDNQWLNSEVADFSLSSFLGHLESPVKTAQPSTSTVQDDNHLSQDVDAQLQSLLTESSIDYMAKFADLAAQVVSDVKK